MWWRMAKHNKQLQVLVLFFTLAITTSKDEGYTNAESLWGKEVDFTQSGCGYWHLKPEHSLPSLDELSVCINIKRRFSNSNWTGFMYLHPDKTHVQFGLKGHGSELRILMFGRVWTTSSVVSMRNWHSICITWSKSMTAPNVYVNGTLVPLKPKTKDPPLNTHCCSVASGGTLTLAVAHMFVGNKMVIETGTELKGSLSLFRLWGKVRSAQDISKMACTDGDILHWEARIWEKDLDCHLIQDVTQQCDWPFYEVQVVFIILRKDGNKTNVYDAREIAHEWLRHVLPSNIYLNKVLVDAIGGSLQRLSGIKGFHYKLRATTPGISQFDCLAHLNVIPGADVGEVQNELSKILAEGYNKDYYNLMTHPDFIHIYPIEDLLLDPTTTVTHTTKKPSTTTIQSMSTTTEAVTTPKPITTSTIQMKTTLMENTSTIKEEIVSSSTATKSKITTSMPSMTTILTESSPTTKEAAASSSRAATTITTYKSATETTQTPSSSTIKETTVLSSTVPATTISTSVPFMNTTLTESSSTIKEEISVPTTASWTLTTNTCSSAISPEAPMSDSFFKVNLNLTIECSDNNPEGLIKAWLSETFTSEGISVLNFKLLTSTLAGTQSEEEDTRPYKVEGKRSLLMMTSHSCFFQVQVTSSSNIEETQEQIQDLLDKPYINGSMSLDAEPEDILISYIEPGLCAEHKHQTRQGLFTWTPTEAERITSHICEGNPSKTAYRKCLLGAISNKALWMDPDLGQCEVVVNSLTDLEDIAVTSDNAKDILIMIEDLLHENTVLDENELSTVLNKLVDVINVSVITPDLGEAIINVTSDILESESNLQPFTNSILNITESVGDKMSGFSGDSVSLVAPSLAISVVNIDPGNFHNLTFGVSSANKGSYPEIYINQEPFDGTVAFISLPSVIQESFPILNHTSPRIQFQFYGVPTLFQTKDDPVKKNLNTYVVSASVTNATGTIKNLKEYVAVTLQHLKPKAPDQGVQCVYWDFSKNDGYGGWNPSGCWTYNVSKNYTTCLCDHLTHFGVLLDVSRTPIDEKNERILTIITYLGCGVSSCFLGITVLTYTLLEKLRRDYPSKILLNLSLALLGLNLMFLLNSWISSFGIYGLCIAMATALHYFLLTSFTWMGLGAVNMYFALVKVFNVYVPSYILKFCILGWGIPLLICSLVLAVKRDAYGMMATNGSLVSLDDSDMFCWVQDNVVFYVSVVSYIALILLCNGSIFLVVLIQIRNMQVNQPAGSRSGLLKDLRAVASLTFLLGLTWAVAFFAWGPVKVFLLYLFSILNSLQGFFIFVFHCLMKENVRKQWRIHLCCGVFKLQDYSEWSHTATVVNKPKPSPPNKFPFMASVRSIKSNSTQSSSASSECSERQASITRPDLGFVYENSLVLPRVNARQSLPPRDAPPPTGSGCEFSTSQSMRESDIDIYPK